MNKNEATVARDNSMPVVDIYTGCVGIIESIKPDGKAMVLYLGERLAKVTQLGDLRAVQLVGTDADGKDYAPYQPLAGAGTVHGGQKGAEGK